MKPLLVLTLLAATPAWADCPTGTDLTTGIRVVESDGVSHIYRDIGKGVVQVDIDYGDGFTSRNLLAQGNHVLQLADTENGQVLSDSVSNTAYPTRAADLPVPTPNMVWNVDTTVKAFGDIYAEKQTQTWGDTFNLTIGTCSYDAIEGALTYTADDYTITEGVYYIATLGIGLLFAYEATDVEREIYTFSDIAAVQ